VGLRFAGGKYRTLLAMIQERVRVRFRGLGFVERAAASIPTKELMRVDVCELASHRLSMVNMAQFLLFQAKHIRLSLQAGAPSRVGVGLLNEAMIRAFEGGSSIVRAAEIWKKAKSLADSADNPLVLARTMMWGGYVAWAGGEWKKALSMLERAEEIAIQGHVT